MLPRSAAPTPVPRAVVLAQNQATAVPAVGAPLDLEWSVPAECPGADAIRAEVIRLTGPAKPSTRHLKAWAAIRPTADAIWQLSLVTELDGVRGERSLSGSSCDSLADAATVMLALILNPDLAAPQLVADETPKTVVPAPASDARVIPRWRLGALAGIQTGVMANRSSAFALSLGGDLGRLSLRLLVGLTPPQDILVPGVPAEVGGRLWLLAAAALGCWTADIGPFGLSPCLGVEVSRLHGRGIGVDRPGEAVVYWSAAELALFLGLPVGRRVLLEVGGMGLVPFGRPGFYLNEIGPVSRPAAFDFRAMGGIAWIFR